MKILKRIHQTIAAYDMIRKGEVVVCGVSGGPDSIAMLNALKEINDATGYGWKIIAAHVNHGLRGNEADQDEQFVRTHAEALGVQCIVRKVDVRKVKAEGKMTLEEAGRKARYMLLRQIAAELHAQKIAVGHTADDQAETVLFRVIRGSALRGLRGIPPIRIISRRQELFIVRPLIDLRRNEVIEYLTARSIPYRTDSSNFDTRIARNFIRHTLIPLIEKNLNPSLRSSLVKLGQISAASYGVLREVSREFLESVRLSSTKGYVYLNVEELNKYPAIVQSFIFEHAIKEVLGKPPNIGFVNYVDIIRVASTETSGKVVMLPDGLRVAKYGNTLRFYKEVKAELKPLDLQKKKLAVPGSVQIKPLGYEISATILKSRTEDWLKEFWADKTAKEEVVDFNKIAFPIYVRFRKKGEKFRPLGFSGDVRLKDFFSSAKVPKDERDRVPLIVDANDNILWVVGFRVSDTCRVDDKTKKMVRFTVRKI